MISYYAIIFKDKKSDYSVHFPDLPGCVTAGETEQEAIYQAGLAIGAHLTLEDGLRPMSRSKDEIMQDKAVIDDLNDGGVLHLINCEV